MLSPSRKWLNMVIIFLSCIQAEPQKDECGEARCSHYGPEIRFPFRLKGAQPRHCSHSRSFDLSCSASNKTLLRLPKSATFSVDKINYRLQIIHLSDPDSCFPRLIRYVNLSSSPFKYADDAMLQVDYNVFSCASEPEDAMGVSYATELPSCVNGTDHKLYAVTSSVSIDEVVLISCTMMYRLVSIPSDYWLLDTNHAALLSWSSPDCFGCEAKGRCGLNSNSTKPVIECFGVQPGIGANMKLVISGSIIGPLILSAVACALYTVHRKRKAEEQNEANIVQFLADYEAFKPARYSYADVKRITNQFSVELGEGAYGTVYRGKLSDEVHVAVKVLNVSNGNGEEFINEVGIMAGIHHVNIIRLVGFCADGFHRALVYEFLPNGSLQSLISPENGARGSLGWEKMNEIALGISRGIEYLHQGCDQRILHFDIKPHNVLLDRNFNPKISDFGTAKLCAKDQSKVSMTAARGTAGYIAPEVFSRNFGDVSYKSDVYSFGMLLLEMVGSQRKGENEGQLYMPEWIYQRIEQKQSLEVETAGESDARIAKTLAVVGLWCMQWQPGNRPLMSAVVKMLEGNEELDVPPNPFTKGLALKNINNLSDQQALSLISELDN